MGGFCLKFYFFSYFGSFGGSWFDKWGGWELVLYNVRFINLVNWIRISIISRD